MTKSHWPIALLTLILSLGGCAPNKTSPEEPHSAPAISQEFQIPHTERNLREDKILTEQGKSFLAIGDSPVLGDDDAPITIVAYMDIMKDTSIAQKIKELYVKNPGKIRIVYKHHIKTSTTNNTIPIHRALEAARRQGKFWEMAERLFLSKDIYAFTDDRSSILTEETP